ncbi:hypothetical protein [Streptomyces sp. NPDC049881]|uniref:hypothetical protein n=1 Tax=Streptomyces sp. NPDC049881 TaxID=3155778 RepID=UPI0034411BF2
MKSRTILRAAAVASATLVTLTMGNPAQAADKWQNSGFHVGDLCTTGVSLDPCHGSASFVKDGDHLYVWDNVADGWSAFARYYRSDVSGLAGFAWNYHGAGTRIDHNMDIPENGWINYEVCLGEYGTRLILDWTCSNYFVEDAS